MAGGCPLSTGWQHWRNKWGQFGEHSSFFMAIAKWVFSKSSLPLGDTSKEPVGTWGMQVSSTNFKGLQELPEFHGPECNLYLAVMKLAESDPLQTHRSLWLLTLQRSGACFQMPDVVILVERYRLGVTCDFQVSFWSSSSSHLLPLHMCVPAQQLSLHLP